MPLPLILFLALLFLYTSFGHLIGSTKPDNGDSYQSSLSTLREDGSVSSKYRNSFLTFANLRGIDCFSASDKRYDIAFLGAPFDTGTTGSPGARFGPNGIREGSRRINEVFGYNIYTHENPFKGWPEIVDCGDASLTFLDNTVALRTLEQAHKIVSGRTANSLNVSHTPRIITLGGDHTTTLPALRSVHEHFGNMTVIHFDSHLDTWDPKIIGGSLSEYAGLTHGTFLSYAHSEGLFDKGIHVGSSGSNSR
jgi:agmatinase